MNSIKFFDPKILYDKFPGQLTENDVIYIQEWLKTQPHLPSLSVSEVCLFLNASYFHKEKCKTRIDEFYTIRSKLPAIFSNRNIRDDDMTLSSEVV